MTQGWPSANDPIDVSFGQMAGPVHLPSLTVQERNALMTDVREWVRELITRHHIDSRVIPPCWERHNGMVEALLALRDLERDRYSDNAPPSAALDWFRGFREVEGRLLEIAAITNCTTREHRDPPPGWPELQPDSAGAPRRT